MACPLRHRDENIKFCRVCQVSTFVSSGTPLNYSRRESLSSLSCDDDDDDDEVNITIINRVNEAMMKRLQDNKEAKANASAQSGNATGAKANSRLKASGK